jgi:hypothetical protein
MHFVNSSGIEHFPHRWRSTNSVTSIKPKRRNIMRCIVFVKASKESEAGVLPSTELLTSMGKFNEELVKAGVMLAGEGLKPSSAGKRIAFNSGAPTVTGGPFAETKELVAGFWIWQVGNLEEAVEWLKRSPFGPGAEVEIRPIFEAEDFGANLTPELKEREESLRSQIASTK